MLDLQNDFEDVVALAKRAMTEYAAEHGPASAMVFHVEAVHGSIEVYASTTLTLKNLQRLLETPLAEAGDFLHWHKAKQEEQTLGYLQQQNVSYQGEAEFNDFVTVMVGDAVKEACTRVPAEQLPKAILVHAAIYSGGTYGIEIHPRKDDAALEG
jgi:hypothetical protein